MAETTEVEIDNSLLGKIKASGSVGFLLVVAIGVGVGYIIMQLSVMKAEASQRESAYTKAMERLADAQEKANKIHTKTNCLIGYEGPKERRNEFCDRVSQ